MRTIEPIDELVLEILKQQQEYLEIITRFIGFQQYAYGITLYSIADKIKELEELHKLNS